MLTKRQAEILTAMIAAEDCEAFDAAEIVCEGLSCYLGYGTVSRCTVDGLLRCVAIRLASEPGSLERYVVTETGRLIGKDPSVADKVMAALAAGIPCDAGGNPI